MANEKRLIDALALIEHLQREATRPFVAPTALPPAFRAYVDRVIPRLIYDVIHFVERWPSVEAVEVVHGHWCWEGRFRACSECGSYVEFTETLGASHWKYCPYCGAKMDADAAGRPEV